MEVSSRITIPLTARLPGYHLIAGFGVLLLAGWAKQALPPEIGASPLVQYPCDFLTAVLFSLGSFLAFRALLVQPYRRRILVMQQFLGLATVLGLLAIYYTYLILSRTIDLYHQDRNILPKLVENARTQPTEAKRILQAKYAYRFYGVTLAYPLEDGRLVFYEPAISDEIKWQEQAHLNQRVKYVGAFLERNIIQMAYLFGLYAGTFIATYFFGSVILIWEISVRQRPLEGKLTDSDFRL